MLDGIHLCLELPSENTFKQYKYSIRHHIVQMVHLSPCIEENITFFCVCVCVCARAKDGCNTGVVQTINLMIV